MKGFVFSLLLIALFFACTKEQPVPPIITPPDPVDTTIVPIDTYIIGFGKSFVLKNNENWNVPIEAKSYSGRYDNFRLRCKITDVNLRSQGFTIYDIPRKTGMYLMEYDFYWREGNLIPQPFFWISQDFDQNIGMYQVDTTKSGSFIEVLYYDSLANVVEGRFQVFMGKESGQNAWNVPDSIFLTAGKFHLKIQE